jgi:hypothetical protein
MKETKKKKGRNTDKKEIRGRKDAGHGFGQHGHV